MIIDRVELLPVTDHCGLQVVCPVAEYRKLLKYQNVDMGYECTLEIKRRRKRRSRDANAYYWVLANKIAEAAGMSKPEAHNFLLARYGTQKTVGERPLFTFIPDTDDYRNDTENHLVPTGERRMIDGEWYRKFKIMKGSHEYDTREMSVLIDGTISEARLLGIETMTPRELAELEGYERRMNE